MEALNEGCGAATLRRDVTGGRCHPSTPPRPPELERFAKGGSDKLFSLIRLKEFPLGANGVYLSQLSRPGQEAVNPRRREAAEGGRDTSPAAGDERRSDTTSRHKRGARERQPSISNYTISFTYVPGPEAAAGEASAGAAPGLDALRC